MELLIKNANVFGQLEDILLKDGKIAQIGSRLRSENIFDANGSKVFPGLIDIHTHGCGGADVMEGKASYISKILKSHGTTSFCPTTMTVPKDDIKRICGQIPDTSDGAHFLGYHIEGPFVSREKCGAQNTLYLSAPDSSFYNSLENTALVVIAPELENSEEFIRKCKTKVAVGHTAADYSTALNAFNSGADCVTHTFNAMPEPHHRKLTLLDAAFEKNAYVQLISDGFHVSRLMVNFLFKVFGSDRVILISDSLAAAGSEDGEYIFGGQTVTVKDKKAYTSDGHIAGSTSFLLDCVKKAIEFGIDEKDAFTAAAQTPAEYLGIKKGKIEAGFDADLIITDYDYNLLKVITSDDIR